MSTDEPDGEDPAFGSPLPREDRLWRHPSEMSDEGPKQQIVLVTKSSASVGRMAVLALVAGLIGALTTTAVLLSTDSLRHESAARSMSEVIKVSTPSAPDETQLAIAEGVLPSIARIEATGPKGVISGTAIVFRSDGLLITNADTVDAADSLTVYFTDGAKLEGADVTLVGKSTDTDVAVVKVNRDGLVPAKGADAKSTWGARTIMIDASPQTHGAEINVGLVTKEVAEVARGEAQPPVYGLVQVTTRASVSTRGAGTVFVDDAGTVIGLVTSRAEGTVYAKPERSVDTAPLTGSTVRDNDTGNAQHFAVPGDIVWDIARQIVDKGQVIKPWLGLPRGDDIPQTELERDGLGGGGMKVTFMDEDSPARKATLRVGDVIVALGKENIASYNDFVAATRRLEPGDQIDVTYIRNNEISHQFVTVTGKPELP